MTRHDNRSRHDKSHFLSIPSSKAKGKAPCRSLQRNAWPSHRRPVGTGLESLEYAIWSAHGMRRVKHRVPIVRRCCRDRGKIALVPVVARFETGSTVIHLWRWGCGVNVPPPLWTFNAIAMHEVVTHGPCWHNKTIVSAIQSIGKIAYLPFIHLATGG